VVLHAAQVISNYRNQYIFPAGPYEPAGILRTGDV
jgi:hypothetical protein